MDVRRGVTAAEAGSATLHPVGRQRASQRRRHLRAGRLAAAVWPDGGVLRGPRRQIWNAPLQVRAVRLRRPATRVRVDGEQQRWRPRPGVSGGALCSRRDQALEEASPPRSLTFFGLFLFMTTFWLTHSRCGPRTSRSRRRPARRPAISATRCAVPALHAVAGLERLGARRLRRRVSLRLLRRARPPHRVRARPPLGRGAA